MDCPFGLLVDIKLRTAPKEATEHVSPEQHSKMLDLQVIHIAHAQLRCSEVTGI